VERFRIGDRVTIEGEPGVIIARSGSDSYTWLVDFGKGSPVPYNEDEFDLMCSQSS
jgi:hypothetical protein